MVFNSFEFLFFFPAVTLLYFLVPPSVRWALVLAASAVFYMAFVPWYILILAFTIAVDYAAGRLIENSTGRARRAWLWASLAANLGVLAVFKYAYFAQLRLAEIFKAAGAAYPWPLVSFLLPIGLSFHTFQAMSYTIEVYRGRQKAERHPGVFALYVLFYPQLVAGPIERPGRLLPQLHAMRTLRFDGALAASGLRLMAWGLFKKTVIADRLAISVNEGFSRLEAQSGPSIALLAVFFAYQIYCDFSGYSDIAIGAARVMGIRLTRNFEYPYASSSIVEFWRRWHVSLSTWFRDYVYLPLGGSRSGAVRCAAAVAAAFLLSGLWHGAGWNFVAWGALHGAYVLAWRALLPNEPASKAGRAAGTAATFVLVSFAWIFFRADSLGHAALAAGRLFRGWTLDSLRAVPAAYGEGFALLYTSVAAIAFLEAVQWAARRGVRLETLPAWQKWPCYWSLVAGVGLAGIYRGAPFIYFQF